MVENKFGKGIKILRFDNGREYVNANLDNYIVSRGIVKENTAPYTPEQNGRSERDNRTIVESARTMLHAKALPLSLWAEATSTAVYIINRTGSSSVKNGATPYELWMGRKPNLEHMKIFGSEAYMHIPKQFTKKLNARAKEVIFVGYHGDSPNYRVYDSAANKVSVSRNVLFNEFDTKPEPSKSEQEAEVRCLSDPDLQDQEDVLEGQENVLEDQQAVPGDAATPHRGIQLIGDDEDIAEPHHNLRNRDNIRKPSRFELNIAEYTTPCSFQEAVTGPQATQWKQAIQDELQALRQNETWKVVERQHGMKTIDSKWVFKLIKNPEI